MRVRRRSKVNRTGCPMFEQPIKTWEKRYPAAVQLYILKPDIDLKVTLFD